MRTAYCPTYLDFHDLASHFLALTAGDRTLRFGWVISDIDIVAYVETLLRRNDTAFVLAEPEPDVAGAVHLEFTEWGTALGLSVSAWARGKGIGAFLLERAALSAGAQGVSTLFVRNLGVNAPLRRLARRVGMKVACAPDARSTRLEIPAGAGHAGPVAARSVAGRITLADASLRFGWDARPILDFPALALPEPILS